MKKNSYSFDELKENLEIGDYLYITFLNDKTEDMWLIRKEENQLVCKSDKSNNQEIYLSREGYCKYYEQILINHINAKEKYSTQINKYIKDLRDERKRVVKAYLSNNFCDNRTSLNVIETLTNMICIAIYTMVKG